MAAGSFARILVGVMGAAEQSGFPFQHQVDWFAWGPSGRCEKGV